MSQQDWCGVGLEAGDGLGSASCSNNIHCLTHSHTDRQRLELLIKCDQHSGLHCSGETIEQVVRFS